MALLALPLIDIFILLGIFSAVFVVFRIIARFRQDKALNDYQQSTSARLMELDSLKS